LQFTVDKHPLVAGEHTRFVLHASHVLSFTNQRASVSPLGQIEMN
jgi:hypothetical protein